MEVGGLCELMSWVMGFGRQAEVLEPEHLRTAVAEELSATAEKYVEDSLRIYYEDSNGGLSGLVFHCRADCAIQNCGFWPALPAIAKQ
jgi:hypothetical protein